MSEMPPPSVPPAAPPPPPGGSYTPPPPSGPAPGSDRTLMVALAYLWILAIIPLVAKKEDREVQWHAKNGLVLLGVEIIFMVLFMVLGFMDITLGCGTTIIQCVIWIGFLVIRIMAIMKAVNGQRMRIPVVSDMADKM